MKGKKVILDLCGGTGAWSRPYAESGDYDVLVVTFPDDVRIVRRLSYPVYGILAAPPCTVFAAAGNRWKRTEREMIEGLSVVDACLRLIWVNRPKFWALENPRGKLIHYLGPPKLYFDPCDYGDPYTKKTLLWGEFNAPKKNRVEPTEGSKIHLKYSGAQKKERSITPTGFAKAFFEANQ